MTGRLTAGALVGLILWSLPLVAQTAKPMVQAEISRLADTAHLEFKGLKNWRYDVQKAGEKTIVLNVPSIEAASVARLQAFSDSLVESVKVDKNGPDGSYSVQFNLTHADVETFDYLTDEPSRLIVDFYRKAPVEAKKPQAETKSAANSAAKNKAQAKSPAKKPGDYEKVESGRKPAGDEFLSVPAEEKESNENVELRFGIFDGGDENYDRFRIKDYEVREEAIISSRQNIYLPFPALKMNISQLEKLSSQQPEYIIHPKNNRENKEARLLMTLFQRKRFAVFLKTFDYFTGKYPDSEYTEILKNLAANIYLERWRQEKKMTDFDKARSLYAELVHKYPGSPLREYNYLILGYAQLERGDALGTLQIFQAYLKEYPKTSEVPQVHKVLAEAFMILNKHDEASAQYQTIINNFPKTAHAEEAKYRLGDVQFARGDYSAAIAAYEAAVKELPHHEKIYPNASFNMAEARFWQKDYRKALNDYVQFVNLFPRHDFGGYALTRVGELLGILGADQRRVMGAFLESYFRFPNHPGAKVARIRMLSQQMRSMKPKELKRALEEIEETAKNLKNLDGIGEFTTLMVAEGLTHRGEYTHAIDNLISYYQKNPVKQNVFKSRIQRNIANELKENVEQGDFLKALGFYSKFSNNWLKNSDRIDVPYLLGGAYEEAGAFSEAQNIYQQALNRRMQIVNSDEEKTRKVEEHLPSVSSLNLRLAAVNAQDRKYIEAFQHLKTVGAGADLTPAETVERVRLSAMIAEQRNDHGRAREALIELAKKWQGDPALVAPVNLQLAQNYLKLGDAKQAEAYAQKVLDVRGGEKPVAEKVIAEAMNAKGDALFAQKKAIAAVETYQNLLENFEAKMPLANVRYRVGEILFERGDLKGAADVWQKLEGTPNEFLWKVGREKLEDAKWQGDYTKYTNRIPAMVSSKKENKQ